MQVIDIFKRLCTIPHCSHATEAMKKFLVDELGSLGYTVSTDEAGNILGCVDGAQVTLQSHYDMVCIGKAPELVLVEASGWLSAEDSTLGADNGIGMAMMLALAYEGKKVDLLFTADEEVGLLGARALGVKLQTPYLLNLDSEEEGVVTIGCAGGVDIIATLPVTWRKEEGCLYETEITGLPGGHSGIDIDKEIPNAIKYLTETLNSLQAQMLSTFNGGERRNAIAKAAKAVFVHSDSTLADGHIMNRGYGSYRVMNEGDTLIKLLHNFVHGVRSMNEGLGIVETSINLAQVVTEKDHVVIHLSARSMDARALRALEEETRRYFETAGCSVKSEGFYVPWKPEHTPFVQQVLDSVEKHAEGATVGAIHAGLECGILKEHFPAMDMASIGPNIENPHSTRERVELASVERVYQTVRMIVENVK